MNPILPSLASPKDLHALTDAILFSRVPEKTPASRPNSTARVAPVVDVREGGVSLGVSGNL